MSCCFIFIGIYGIRRYSFAPPYFGGRPFQAAGWGGSGSRANHAGTGRDQTRPTKRTGPTRAGTPCSGASYKMYYVNYQYYYQGDISIFPSKSEQTRGHQVADNPDQGADHGQANPTRPPVTLPARPVPFLTA